MESSVNFLQEALRKRTCNMKSNICRICEKEIKKRGVDNVLTETVFLEKDVMHVLCALDEHIDYLETELMKKIIMYGPSFMLKDIKE